MTVRRSSRKKSLPKAPLMLSKSKKSPKLSQKKTLKSKTKKRQPKTKKTPTRKNKTTVALGGGTGRLEQIINGRNNFNPLIINFIKEQHKKKIEILEWIEENATGRYSKSERDRGRGPKLRLSREDDLNLGKSRIIEYSMMDSVLAICAGIYYGLTGEGHKLKNQKGQPFPKSKCTASFINLFFNNTNSHKPFENTLSLEKFKFFFNFIQHFDLDDRFISLRDNNIKIVFSHQGWFPNIKAHWLHGNFPNIHDSIWNTTFFQIGSNVFIEPNDMIDMFSVTGETSRQKFAIVDFANKCLGGGVLGHGAVQEEIMFCRMPELVYLRDVSDTMGPDDAVLIENARLLYKSTGYGNTLRFDRKLSAQELSDEFELSQRRKLLAVDAIKWNLDRKEPEKYILEQLKPENIRKEFWKIYVGFKGCKDMGIDNIYTGNWGCGAFNGFLQMKFLIQVFAAKHANVILHYNFYDQMVTKSRALNFLKDQINGFSLKDIINVISDFYPEIEHNYETLRSQHHPNNKFLDYDFFQYFFR